MNDDNKSIVNEDEMNENSELDMVIDTQEESMEDPLGAADDNNKVHANWIKVINGKFVCSECENESKPETNTVDGTVEADTEEILSDLTDHPTKIIYGSCPICGMEYVFKLNNNELYMEPSDMLK